MQNRNTTVLKCILNRGRRTILWSLGGAAAPPAPPSAPLPAALGVDLMAPVGLRGKEKKGEKEEFWVGEMVVLWWWRGVTGRIKDCTNCIMPVTYI